MKYPRARAISSRRCCSRRTMHSPPGRCRGIGRCSRRSSVDEQAARASGYHGRGAAFAMVYQVKPGDWSPEFLTAFKQELWPHTQALGDLIDPILEPAVPLPDHVAAD